MGKRIILVNGVSGQLGSSIQRVLSLAPPAVKEGYLFLERKNFDLSKPERIQAELNSIKPSIIVNCAAYTQVDKAEDEMELANKVNHLSVAEMAKWAKSNEAHLIHFSTDYVYSGLGEQAWSESDSTAPVNFYGKTKLDSENAILASQCSFHIFRTSWVHSPVGVNFVRTMYRLFQEKEELNVVDDQVGAPTYAVDLANFVSKLCELENDKLKSSSGIYNYCNSGQTSWYGFAKHLHEYFLAQKIELKTKKINPIVSDQYPTKAKRPLNSRMNSEKFQRIFGLKIPSWQSGGERCVLKILENENLV